MICVCLNATTFEKNNHLLQINQNYADLFELRVDFLDKNELHWNNIEQWKQQLSLPGICTIREHYDGGHWSNNDSNNNSPLQKQDILIKIIQASLFEYVDIELQDSTKQENTSFILAAHETSIAHNSTCRIILSQHVFTPHSAKKQTHHEKDNASPSFSAEELIHTLRYYANKYPFAIIKYAIHCNSSADFHQYLIASNELQKDAHEYILIPMGSFGQAARILSYLSSSLWTYCSPDVPDSTDSSSTLTQTLGQISAYQLDTMYRYHELQLNTNNNIPVFAVIGDPVLHSKSPQYFNALFQKKNKKAVYIHLHSDTITHIQNIAEYMNIQGLSVTVPHKSTIISTLKYSNQVVQACASCNTVLCTQKEWKGYNTDVFGFLHPLLKTLHIPYKEHTSPLSIDNYHNALKDISCLIIGAGGSAKSVAYALQLCGANILIANRSIDNAKIIAQHFSPYPISYCLLQDYATMKQWNADIIVQTTSVGMTKDISPLPAYHFSGKETVYDIIYTPPETKFLREAKQHGCSTMNGSAMFSAQAKEQAYLFLQQIDKNNKTGT